MSQFAAGEIAILVQRVGPITEVVISAIAGSCHCVITGVRTATYYLEGWSTTVDVCQCCLRKKPPQDWKTLCRLNQVLTLTEEIA